MSVNGRRRTELQRAVPSSSSPHRSSFSQESFEIVQYWVNAENQLQHVQCENEREHANDEYNRDRNK